MSPQRQAVALRRAEIDEQKEPTPLHYEFAKGYLPTVNPKTDEIGYTEHTETR